MDSSYDRFQQQLDKKNKKEEKDRKRKGGAALVGGAGGPASVGLDWSSPGAMLRSAWRGVFLSPHTGWLRAALGLGVALQLAWMGSAYFMGKMAGPKSQPGGAVWFPRRPPPTAAANARPPLANLIRGMKYLFNPPPVVDAAADASAAGDEDGYYGDSASGEAGAVPLGAVSPAPGDAMEGGEDAGAAENEEKPALDSMGGAGALSSGGGGGAAALGAGAAGMAGAGGASLPEGSGAGTAKSMKRRMRAARGGKSLKGSRLKGGKLSALKQLRFSEKKSKSAKYSGKSGQAYSEAAEAFGEGQAGAPPIDGAGAGTDGAGVGTSASDTKTVAPGTKKEEFCPSGTTMSGGVCVPVSGENKTPYQGMLDQAKLFLIGAAAMALLGLFLLSRSGNPVSQILGGILLGAAAALVLAAVSIGNFIGDNYGQKRQADAVQTSGDNAMNGDSPQ